MTDEDLQLLQANRLEAIVQTVQAVADGCGTAEAIAGRLGFVQRQGAYYRAAAELLDFVAVDDEGCARLTSRGRRLLAARDDLQRRAVLRVALGHVAGVMLISEALAVAPARRYRTDELEATLRTVSSLSATTLARRFSTLLAWMEAVGWIAVEGEHVRLIDAPRPRERSERLWPYTR